MSVPTLLQSVLSGSFDLSDSAMVDNAAAFSYGFLLGFLEVDVVHMRKCNFTYSMALERINAVSQDVTYMRAGNNSQEAFRDILHIVEKLPDDLDTCSDIMTLLQALTDRVLQVMDIVDLAKTLTQNLVLHSMGIMNALTDASFAMVKGKYFKAGFQLGTAFNIFL